MSKYWPKYFLDSTHQDVQFHLKKNIYNARLYIVAHLVGDWEDQSTPFSELWVRHCMYVCTVCYKNCKLIINFYPIFNKITSKRDWQYQNHRLPGRPFGWSVWGRPLFFRSGQDVCSLQNPLHHHLAISKTVKFWRWFFAWACGCIWIEDYEICIIGDS